MSTDSSKGTGFGPGQNGNSPPHKKPRSDNEEPMDIDDSDTDQGSVKQTQDQGSGLPAQSSSTDSNVQPAAQNVPPPAVPSTSSGETSRRIGVKRKYKKAMKHEYKTYSDSFMDKQADLKPLSTKPPELLPSDQSVDQAAAQNITPPNAPAQPQPPAAVAPDLAAPVPPAGGEGSQQIQPQIIIRYGDGREEVIDVNNVDSVRRVAKAAQVITPQGSLSASYPQASKPHQMSTASLPLALQAGVPFDEEADVAANVPADVSANLAAPPPQDASQGQSTSGDPQHDSDGSSTPKATEEEDKKERQKYQSYSAPAVSEDPDESADPAALISTPMLSATKNLKMKVVTTLQLLNMKAELDKIAEELELIEQEKNLTEDEKKGIQLLRKLIDDFLKKRQHQEEKTNTCHRCTIS